jgi:hypothetical protein
MPRRVRTLLVAVALLALAAVAVPALAATKHGVRPLSPKAGSSVPAGKAPTFRGKVRGKGSVWVFVCKSPRRNAKGLICSTEMIRKARRTGGHGFEVKARMYDYPGFWLNRPGTYYWQAHRIRCARDRRDCAQEGPVVRFKVG